MVEPNTVRIYVCGPTVYDAPHIGNLRPVLSFDFFTRALNHRELPFFYVHNITDIDDKIIRRAQELGESEAALASRYLKVYAALLRKYHIQRPTVMPRVTKNLPAVHRVIKKLVANHVTYATSEGLFLATNQVPTYGEVSGQNRAALRYDQTGVVHKQSPADFAL